MGMLAKVCRPEIQQQLDEVEKKAKGQPSKFRAELAKLLIKQVHPFILDHLGLPEGTGALMTRAIQAHSVDDISIVETWVELETALRNKPAIALATDTLKSMRQKGLLDAQK